MGEWFEEHDCIRDDLARRYTDRRTNWITGCSVRDRDSSRYHRIRKCTFCAGPEGLILLLNCLVGGGGCVLAGTRIRMADGSEKRVEEVEAGDQVRACAIESESILDAVVERVARHRPEEMGDYYLRLNGTLRVTPYHPMYANGEWIPAGGLREGDVLLTIGGSRRVETIDAVYDQAYVFDLALDGPIAYFANELAVPTKIGFASYFKEAGSRIQGDFMRATREPRGGHTLRQIV